MDIVLFLESFIGFVFNCFFWSAIIIFGLIIIAKPKLLFIIPLYILKGIFLLLLLLSVKVFDLFINFCLKLEVSNFEKCINNVGIKKDLDIGACHSFFNRVDSDKISLLFDIYYGKVAKELKKDDYDEALVGRYINLLEIMNRCMVFKQEKSPY